MLLLMCGSNTKFNVVEPTHKKTYPLTGITRRSECRLRRVNTVLQRQALLRRLRDAPELLHQLIQLRDVVVDVFVAGLGIEVAG